MKYAINSIVLGIALLAGSTVVGCSSSTTPGDVNAVTKPVAVNTQRVGNVYLLRGWLGIFSAGMNVLTDELGQAGVEARVFQDTQWSSLAEKIRQKYLASPNREPLILIGHSYGADDVVRIAKELNRDHITVDLLVTLDPVTPPIVPTNVLKCMNLYESNGFWDTFPWLRGVPVKKPDNSATVLVNADIRTDRTDLLEPNTDHFNIEKKEKIHKEIINLVLLSCPPRGKNIATRSRQAAAPTTQPIASNQQN